MSRCGKYEKHKTDFGKNQKKNVYENIKIAITSMQTLILYCGEFTSP